MLPEEIIVRPVITEKSARLATAGQYVFVVHPDANKPQVAEAIEKLFKVKVVSVRTVTRHGKVKRRGAHYITRPSTRRAIVTLAKGLTLDVTATG
ncbi:MAG: 50S ribosomal protein L23 [Candidatus Coatesbacteria bacterium]